MIQEDTIKNIEKVSVDYNTEREKLLLPEYGRCVQQMVDHAKSLEDKEERQRCATTIVALMANMTEQHGDPEDFRQKLWNHLAAIANYELDIDYPVEIERLEDTRASHERIPYPQKPISRRHYGAIIEALCKKLAETEDEGMRRVLTQQVANQMKRSLGRWNIDAMNDEKVLDDLAAFTNGKISLLPGEIRLISDGEVKSNILQMAATNKKKKKKK